MDGSEWIVFSEQTLELKFEMHIGVAHLAGVDHRILGELASQKAEVIARAARTAFIGGSVSPFLPIAAPGGQPYWLLGYGGALVLRLEETSWRRLTWDEEQLCLAQTDSIIWRYCERMFAARLKQAGAADRRVRAYLQDLDYQPLGQLVDTYA